MAFPVPAYLAAVLFAFVGTFHGAFQMSVYNQPLKIMQDFLSVSYEAQNKQAPSKELLSLLWSTIQSSFDFGCVLGDLLAQLCADRFGRKFAMIGAGIGIVICDLVQVLAYPSNLYQLLIVGRFFGGIATNVGLVSQVVFLSETAPTNIRGGVGSFCHVMAVSATVLNNLIGLPSLLGRKQTWFCLQLFPISAALVTLIAFYWLPESPKFLLSAKKRRAAALESVNFYHGSPDNADEILESIVEEDWTLEPGKSKFGALVGLFRSHSGYRKIAGVVLVFAFAVPLSGMFIMYAYIVFITQKAGFGITEARIISFSYSVMDFVVALFTARLIERTGRRPLTLVSAWSIVGSLLAIFIAQLVTELETVLNPNLTIFLQILTFLGLVCHVIFKSIFICVYFTLACELFPTPVRSTVFAILSMAPMDFTNTVSLLGYLPLDNLIGSYALLVLLILPMILLSAYLTLFVPETKGRNVDQIVQGIQEELMRPSSNYGSLAESETVLS